MPFVERATVAECDRCQEVGYTPITDQSLGMYQIAPDRWLVVERNYRSEDKVERTERLAFCGWACLAEYANDSDITAQAMLVEGG